MKRSQHEKQHENSATREKSNMKILQYENCAIRKNCNMKSVQGEKSPKRYRKTRKEYNTQKVQHEENAVQRKMESERNDDT